ncbi:solute carrier family 22 member 21-like [Thrips palmi]|uniref:Solute carrier family 22 member 21-like n=1 Tax=Thrips palmi TaxID=161013 RepID=A0A6P9AEM9_THRPL|nr:solute carrier family 22 member 21-like [Thrips palmi]
MDAEAVAVEAGLNTVTSRLGPFHFIFCTLLSAAYMYQALFNLTFVFTTMRAEHRCFIPECEDPGASADMRPSWLSMAVPLATPAAGLAAGTSGSGPDPCHRYAPLPAAPGARGCAPGSFSNSTIVPCERRVFPNKDLSIMTEWDMACSANSDWQLAMVGTVNSFGRALGLPLFGLASDALGRRTALLAGLAVSCAVGMARSFAPDYAAFVGLEFLDPVFYDGIGGAAFIMGMELMPTASRGAWSAVSHVVFTVGLVVLGCVAWLLPSWRLLLRVIYGSGLLCLAALWFAPESVRWLAAKGRTADAFKIIDKAARMNGLPRPDFTAIVSRRDKAAKQAKQGEATLPAAPATASAAHRPSFAQDMSEFAHSRVLVLRLVACCACWAMIMFVYDGLAVYSVSLAGNRYLNFILVELAEAPAALLTWKLMSAAGRRATLIWSLVPAAACCVAYHFLPAAAADDVSWPRTAAVVLAKLCVTVAFTTTYVLAAELFPTRVRHTLYAAGATCGRFGASLSPQMPLLAAVMESLPLLVFGAACFCTALVALAFPETANAALPDTVEEAEVMGKKNCTPTCPP